MPKPLAEIVLEEGLATATSLERAAAAADRDGTPLVCALVRECSIDEVALVAALRRHVRVSTGDPATVAPEPEAVRELQRDVCRRQRVAPLSVSSYGGLGRVLRLAMADPTDAVAVAEVEHVTGCRVDPVLMTLSAVEELVEMMYRAVVTEVMKRVSERVEELPPRRERPDSEEMSAQLEWIEELSSRQRDDEVPSRRTSASEPTVVGRTVRGKGLPAGVSGPSTPSAEPAGSRRQAPGTVPFHKLSDEATLEIRLRAVIELLLAKRVIREDELEQAVRRLMRLPDDRED